MLLYEVGLRISLSRNTIMIDWEMRILGRMIPRSLSRSVAAQQFHRSTAWMVSISWLNWAHLPTNVTSKRVVSTILFYYVCSPTYYNSFKTSKFSDYYWGAWARPVGVRSRISRSQFCSRRTPEAPPPNRKWVPKWLFTGHTTDLWRASVRPKRLQRTQTWFAVGTSSQGRMTHLPGIGLVAVYGIQSQSLCRYRGYL